jgi:hypothetical protein
MILSDNIKSKSMYILVYEGLWLAFYRCFSWLHICDEVATTERQQSLSIMEGVRQVLQFSRSRKYSQYAAARVCAGSLFSDVCYLKYTRVFSEVSNLLKLCL